MSWSIADVARMSNVTSRTLRHYDAIGLLTPAGVSPNGYRYYERAQLLRLREILVLRGLGLPLDEIAGVLDQARDQVQVRPGRRFLPGDRLQDGRAARTGAGPDGPRVSAVMAEHHALVSKFWTPDRASYTGLGQMYVDDPLFRARYDARHLALAVYLRDAMEVYGEAHLS